MICDTRIPNVLFRTPPGVSLASGDALSELELGETGATFIDGSDVEVCFYHYELPEWARD